MTATSVRRLAASAPEPAALAPTDPSRVLLALLRGSDLTPLYDTSLAAVP